MQRAVSCGWQCGVQHHAPMHTAAHLIANRFLPMHQCPIACFAHHLWVVCKIVGRRKVGSREVGRRKLGEHGGGEEEVGEKAADDVRAVRRLQRAEPPRCRSCNAPYCTHDMYCAHPTPSCRIMMRAVSCAHSACDARSRVVATRRKRGRKEREGKNLFLSPDCFQ